LLRIFLLLVVPYCASSANDNRRSNGCGSHAGYRSSYHSSSSQHFDLLNLSTH
jgi:hypothetical protein